MSRPLRLSPVDVELFAHRFENIASRMGETLRRTAVSTNVKERLDFSCAVLDGGGELVVNAPHIPVHLGALGVCVRAVEAHLTLRPGDVAVTNHPGFGGSHLPDVTVVTPVFDPGGETSDRPVAFVANRAHHAEIGGSRPGSMPPTATRLSEEGVLISPRRLVAAGASRFADVRELLARPPFPSRAVAENLADLEAAVAANRIGAAELERSLVEHGRARVEQAMRALTERAEARVRQAFARLGSRRLTASERLDDGTPIVVSLTIDGERATVDFTGSGPQHPGNLNAPLGVARSAVLYALRLLVDEQLPLNEGFLRPVDLVVPPSLLNPDFSGSAESMPAVVGGNVETSQRVVDTLLKALGLAACSQGTMNNVLFGNDRFGYYETIGGGTGAGDGFAGADAVHSHMTNTAITDPEVLESRYPVRLEEFAIRRGSGGDGLYAGGCGARRRLRFLEPVSLSIVSQHRHERPYGLAGGGPGAAGSQWLERADGSVEELAGIDQAELAPGDRLCVETPGGGGWGAGATVNPGEAES